MADEFVQVLDIDKVDHVLGNSIALTTLYSYTIPGGTLDVDNSVRWQGQGKIGFDGSNDIRLYSYYAGITVSTILLRANATFADIGLLIEAHLNGDGSVSSQCGLLSGDIGIPLANNLSESPGFGSSGVASGGDNDFEIKAAWSGVGVSNTITISHSTLELLSYIQDSPASDLAEPTAFIWISSPLNIALDYTLRKDLYFYAPMEEELTFMGYGDSTFTRATAWTATWNDGAEHAVAINEPRFEYSAGEPQGLALKTSVETLTFDPDNNLDDGNTLCWLEDGVFKNTPANTNPFNSSGVWAGSTTTEIHIKHLLKFSRVLTVAEIAKVQAVLT